MTHPSKQTDDQDENGSKDWECEVNVKFEKKKSALEKRKENRKKKEVEKEKDRKYEAVDSVLFDRYENSVGVYTPLFPHSFGLIARWQIMIEKNLF